MVYGMSYMVYGMSLYITNAHRETQCEDYDSPAGNSAVMCGGNVHMVVYGNVQYTACRMVYGLSL